MTDFQGEQESSLLTNFEFFAENEVNEKYILAI